MEENKTVQKPSANPWESVNYTGLFRENSSQLN